MTKEQDAKAQVDKFRDIARELEADEDEAQFEDQVRRIAPKGTVPASEDDSPK